MVCPINQAYELTQSLPGAKFIICEAAGHSALEEEIAATLIQETDIFAERFKK